MKEKIYYQWLPGTEQENSVVILQRIFLEDDDVYYEFSDGNICHEDLISYGTCDSKDLIGKALVQIPSYGDRWSFDRISAKNLKQFNDVSHQAGEQNFMIPTLNDYNSTGNKNYTSDIKYTSPKSSKYISIDYKDWMSIMDLRKLGLISETLEIDDVVDIKEIDESVQISKENDITATSSNSSVIEVDKSADINISNSLIDIDPVAILVNKSAKYQSTISMELNIDLPSKSLFKIASENFENGEDTFLDVILSHIDYATIKESLRESLRAAYNDVNNENNE